MANIYSGGLCTGNSINYSVFSAEFRHLEGASPLATHHLALHRYKVYGSDNVISGGWHAVDFNYTLIHTVCALSLNSSGGSVVMSSHPRLGLPSSALHVIISITERLARFGLLFAYVHNIRHEMVYVCTSVSKKRIGKERKKRSICHASPLWSCCFYSHILGFDMVLLMSGSSKREI